MPEFNFSKIEDQKKFEKLSEKDRLEIIGEAQGDGVKIQAGIKESILTPEQKQAKEKIIKCLINGHIDDAIKIKEAFKLPEEVIQSAEVQSAAKEGMIQYLANGYIVYATKIKEAFKLPEEVIQSAAKEGMIKRLANGNVGYAIKIKEAFKLPEEVIQSAAKEGMIKCLANGYIVYATKIKEAFKLPEEVIQSPEVQSAAKEGMIKRLANGDIDDATKIKEAFKLPEEVIQSAAKEGMIQCLANGHFGYAIKIKEAFKLPEEVIQSPEVQSAAKEGMIKCLANGHFGYAIKIKEAFKLPEEVIQSAAKEGMIKCLANGYINDAIKIKEAFKLPEEVIQSPEVRSAAKEEMIQCLANGNVGYAIKIKEAFKLPEGVVQSAEVRSAAKEGMIKCLANGYIDDATKIKEAFKLHLSSQEIIDTLLTNNHILPAAQYNEENGTPNKHLSIAYDILGNFLTPSSYETIVNIAKGQIDEKTKKIFGIKDAGEAGILQLKQKIDVFKKGILSPSFNPEILSDSDFLASFFKSYIRFEKSSWGEHSDASFKEIINNFIELQKEGEIEPLLKGYEPSGEILISKIDRDDQEAFKHSEQFTNRYDALKNSLSGAVNLLKEKKPLSTMESRISEKLKQTTKDLEDKLLKIENPKAKENISSQLSLLKSLDLRSIKSFQKNFSVLSKYKEFHEELRQLTFFYALQNHKNYRESSLPVIRRDNPSFDDISWMADFMGHIVNKETWNKYFTDDQARRSFKDIVNIKALEEELSRGQKQKTKGMFSLNFIPTRGILMEFSGHIGDACWAEKYESIARSFPNFTAVIMAQNVGNKHERLAGATLLIETVSEDKVPLLVIRGLNPLESVINGLNVKDFYEKFIAYAKTIAEKRNRKLAIVIDDHSGGSSTNRPVLFNFLEEEKGDLKNITLESDDTDFNEYNITEDTYLVSE